MLPVNPLAVTQTEQFVVGSSDFSFFSDYPCRNESGALLLCTAGSAEATVNQVRGQIRHNTLLFLLPGAMFMLTKRTPDFQMMFCAFSRELFAEAGFRLEPSFFRFLIERPISYPPQSQLEGVEAWLRVAAYTYNDRQNMFRNTIIRNRIQNMLLEICDKQQRTSGVDFAKSDGSNRQAELFHRFITLVHEHCTDEREVAFYADALCISTRYLSTIVRNIARCSAKEVIDRSVMLELKMLLKSTELSVQEIAYQLHFPDQSYLGRYFKKHAGCSPSQYRNKK